MRKAESFTASAASKSAAEDVARTGNMKSSKTAQSSSVQQMIDQSPRQSLQGRFLVQFRRAQGRFGELLSVQRESEEEEKTLQGRLTAVQRLEDEEPLQGKPETLQRVEEDEEPLKGKFTGDATVQRAADSAPKPNNTGLPDGLKSGVESLSGLSLDHVKVHYNSDRPAQLNALAYAQGTDIHVAPGQERHLPHEAWHVVQQAQGRVQPTMQMRDSVPVNDDPGLEHEADVMGGKALQMAGGISGAQLNRSMESAPRSMLVPSRNKSGYASSSPLQMGLMEILGSAFYWVKSLVVDLPAHLWRLFKHLTIGVGVTLVEMGTDFVLALYEGFHNRNWTAFAKKMAMALLGDPVFWVLKLLAKVLDLVAFGEGMDLIMSIFKWNTRGMNGAEIAACQQVFGNAIDYNRVRVDEHSLLNDHVFRFWLAFTTWHTVNWPTGSSFATDPGTFIHEMTHIWQMERRGTQYIAEAPYGGGLNGAGYVYAVDRNPFNNANGAALAAARLTGSTIWSYNLEQQAEICRHYYERLVFLGALAVGNWQPYIDDVQGINRMPLKAWLKEPAFLP